jgi:hypothetical protein
MSLVEYFKSFVLTVLSVVVVFGTIVLGVSYPAEFIFFSLIFTLILLSV